MKSAMTFRERFEATLNHLPVDRPPMDLDSTDMTGIEGGPRSLAPLLNLSLTQNPEILDEKVLEALHIDMRGVGGILVPATPVQKKISETEFIDCWGIGNQWNGHHYEMVTRPLAGATLDDLEKYPWPRAENINPDDIQRMKNRAQYLFEETPLVVCGRHPYYGIFELGCWMCGFDDFLYRLAGEPEFVHRFFEIIWDYQKKVNELYYGALGRYLHFTTSGDDFGTQTGPFMSPVMFKEMIIPFYKMRISHIQSLSPARFFHHTCGSVHALIPSLIEAGVQILNPVQPRVPNMEPWRLKQDFGNELTFFGGVDTQQLLPKGTPEQVEAAVCDLISVLGKNGGYIVSAAHTIQEDVPAANALALYRAASKV